VRMLYSMRVRVINVTNIVSKTNVIVHEENVFSTKYLWYVVGGFAFVFVVLLLIFLRYRFVKKRMEDLSDLL
jgi:bacteriorhodopsin